MDLYLVRHAAAHSRDPDRWPDDSRRPLTPEGEEGFRPVARGLGGIQPQIDAILSSPYARAWRTAELLAEEAGWPAPEPLPALEPNIPPYKSLLALEPYARSGAIVLVGHRPGLHELAAYLLTGADDGLDIGLKKGGAARLRFSDAPAPGAARLRWLATPKLLRG